MSSLLGQQKMAALAEFYPREIVQPAGNGNGSVPPNSRSWLTIAVFGPQREVLKEYMETMRRWKLDGCMALIRSTSLTRFYLK